LALRWARVRSTSEFFGVFEIAAGLAMVVRLWEPLVSAAPVGKFHCSPVESGATVLWAAITTTNLGNMPFSSSTLMA
jgi:hypothetical protein